MRKLASIQEIKFVKEIPNADVIECVGVLGWECVSKKNEFKKGDKCIYFEIDSILPEIDEFEFLRKSCYRKDLKKFRLKSVKLRGQLSQGLALPISVFPKLNNLEVGTDLTEVLNIEKYEPPIPAQIQGDARSFSWPIEKTDEIRIQQNDEYKFIENLTGNPYYISLKLDGTSCSFILDREDEYHVCGRNYSYKKTNSHSFWKISEKYQIENKLKEFKNKFNINLALQGECVGPGVQKNKLGLKDIDFFVFNVVDIQKGKFHIDEAINVVQNMGLKFVPILERGENFNYSQIELLKKAQGKYREHFPESFKNQEREGIVIRSLCGKISFKAINNDFLLSEQND
jgi:RNA ligase (TIGR02306 family)